MARQDMLVSLCETVKKTGNVYPFERYGETVSAAQDRLLIILNEDWREWILTPAGESLLEENEKKKKARNSRANANRKARDEVMRSVGLTKTRFGWE